MTTQDEIAVMLARRRQANARQWLVYLAGPISGLSYEGCIAWRKEFIQAMPVEIVGISPMRFKGFLAEEQNLAKAGYAWNHLSSPDGIMTRDYYDVRRSDLVLVNLLGATNVSIGTVMELAWSYMLQKPTVVIMEPGNVHDHAMVRKGASMIVEDLETAERVVKAILSPFDGPTGG